jgi:hypothetical protein
LLYCGYAPPTRWWRKRRTAGANVTKTAGRVEHNHSRKTAGYVAYLIERKYCLQSEFYLGFKMEFQLYGRLEQSFVVTWVVQIAQIAAFLPQILRVHVRNIWLKLFSEYVCSLYYSSISSVTIPDQPT